MKTLKKILLILLIAILSAFLVAIGYYFAVTKDAKLDESKLLLPKAQICAYDHAGEHIASGVGFSGRETVRLDRLEAHVKNAFVCVEDKRFYSHNGFDVRRIGKAILENIKAGSFKEGASTISQQLVKNTHLSLEKTINRKLKEYKLTKELEKNYTKDQILELYLNTIYFGHSCYGVECASNFYFGKSASELTLSEAALLAGLVRSPNNYSPFKNPEAALKRRRTVLGLMLSQGAIKDKEYESALNAPLPASEGETGSETQYLRHALNELETLFQKTRLPLQGKIELYTYADLSLQQLVCSLVKSQTSNATVAVLDNATRGVSAFYSTAGTPRRSPASTVKPLAVYAPAFETGILSPATPILDEPVDFGGYSPKNYDGKYHGYITARQALSESLNIPAVKTLNALGAQASANALRRLGLPVEKEEETLALALGGVKRGYTLLELLSAYATFPNDGKYAPCAFLRKITLNGRTVYEHTPNAQVVFSPETAYLTTDILRTCAKTGTAKKLRALAMPIAAKTGTTGGKNGNLDAYAFSYTPLDTVGVWLGNADNTPISATGGGAPTEISLTLHKALQKTRENVPDFERPSSVKSYELDGYSFTNERRLLLADEYAPAKHRFQELFWTKYAPKESSSVFSTPRIATPQISLCEGGVHIQLPKAAPQFYEYEITRKNGDMKEMLYHGKLLSGYTDETAKGGVVYEYTITPYYEKRAGNAIVLPTVKTPQKIPKEWWKN